MSRLLLLDANLAVLLAVGTARRSYVAKHKRLQEYDETDFELLRGFIAKFNRVLFTPNVLTETSNLIRQIKEPARSEAALILAALIDDADERVVASRLAARHRACTRLGLTDAVLLEVAREGAVLLTADLPLYLAAVQARLDAINFSRLRDRRPDFR